MSGVPARELRTHPCYGAIPVGRVLNVEEGERIAGVHLRRCICHDGCPLCNRGAIPEDEWRPDCVCAGKEELESIHDQRRTSPNAGYMG
jgi:hypothetical protein